LASGAFPPDEMESAKLLQKLPALPYNSDEDGSLTPGVCIPDKKHAAKLPQNLPALPNDSDEEDRPSRFGQTLPALPLDSDDDMPAQRKLPALPTDSDEALSVQRLPALPADSDDNMPEQRLHALPTDSEEDTSVQSLPALPMDSDKDQSHAVPIVVEEECAPPFQRLLPALPVDSDDGSTLSPLPKDFDIRTNNWSLNVLPPLPMDLDDQLSTPAQNRLPRLPPDSDNENETPRLADLNAQSPYRLPPLPADDSDEEHDQTGRKRRRAESPDSPYRVVSSKHGSGKSGISTRPPLSLKKDSRGSWGPESSTASKYRRLGDKREVHPKYFVVGLAVLEYFQ
jgi:hypothetical protein